MRILIALFAFFCVSCHSALIFAAPGEKFSIDIPSGYRHESLLLLAHQTNHEILFDISSIPNKRIPATHGTLSVEEALIQLLWGNDITYSVLNKQIRVSIVSPNAYQLPQITVHEYLRDRGVIHNDDSQENFPLFHLPLSIQSISTEQIDEFEAQSISDALNYIEGIEYLEHFFGIHPHYYSRGFATPFSIDGKFYRNSLILIDPVVVERIDIIQGPSASFLAPGGRLNFVTKKPTRNRDLSWSLTAGSYDYYKTTLDIDLSSKKHLNLSGRLIAAYEEKKDIRPYVFEKNYTLAPSMSYTLPQDWQLLIAGYTHQNNEYPSQFTYHDSVTERAIPRDQTMGYPWAESTINDSSLAIDLMSPQINNWTFRTGAYWSYATNDLKMQGILMPDSEGNTYPVLSYYEDVVARSRGIDAAIEKSFSLRNTPTLLRLSLDYQRFFSDTPTYDIQVSEHVFNIYNPNYDTPEPVTPDRVGTYFSEGEFMSLSLLQHLYFTDRLSVFYDIRWENLDIDGLFTDSRFNVNWRAKGDDAELSKQLGINFDLTDTLASHLSYTNSFTNQTIPIANKIDNVFDEEITFVEPIKNHQFEISLKKNWLNQTLYSQISAYYLTQSNIQTFTIENQTPIGEQAEKQYSSGLSVNISGKIFKNTNVIGNINYNNNNVSVSNVSNIGVYTLTAPADDTTKRHKNTAKIIANLWLYYRGLLQNTEFGIGQNYVSKRYGDDKNSFILPAFSKTEILLKYTGKHGTSISFSIRNLFDKSYYESSQGSPYLVELGDPRSAQLTIRSKLSI